MSCAGTRPPLSALRRDPDRPVGLDDDPDDPVVVTGFKGAHARKLTTSEKEAKRALAAARAPVEHGFAPLKNWRILTKLRTDPARATGLLRARSRRRRPISPGDARR